MEDFSILQSVYIKDEPSYLEECFSSIKESTVLPQKIVLVKDGKITEALDEKIKEWTSKLPLLVVGYEENKGLAFALNYGLLFVETDIVARMDSDDIVCPDRFEKQLSFMQNHLDVVLLSGYIEEFNKNASDVVSVRTVPLEFETIKKYLKKRNAFNHMAVMFRKAAITNAGSYQVVPYFEDYDLWIRVVQKGYCVANIPDIFVKARIGNDMIGRRHGLAYAKHEVSFLKRQLSIGFITKREYVMLLMTRVSVRLLPKFMLKLIYKFIRKY